MKMIRFILVGTVLLLNFGFLMGQTESGPLIKPFGIGLHIEQFKLSDIGDLNLAPANKLEFIISPTNSFRLEPEVGVKFGKDKTNNLKNSSVYLGLGAFGMIQRSKLNIYLGLRLEYAMLKWDDTYYSGYTNTNVQYKTNRFTIGPALGCEYYLGENFSFGGELALKYATMKTTIDPKPTGYKDGEGNYFTTDTGLFIRFYF